MRTNIYHILLEKFLQNEATAEEIQQLTEWFCQSNTRKDLSDFYTEKWENPPRSMDAILQNDMMYENPTYTQYNLLKSAFDKRYGKALLKSPQEFNSYYIEDGDYWKIDNVTLGYNITNTGTKYIRSIRVYVSSLNTLIITGYKGIDPEVSLVTSGGGSQSGININSGAGLAPGVDQRDKYPTMRTFTFGLNVTF